MAIFWSIFGPFFEFPENFFSTKTGFLKKFQKIPKIYFLEKSIFTWANHLESRAFFWIFWVFEIPEIFLIQMSIDFSIFRPFLQRIFLKFFQKASFCSENFFKKVNFSDFFRNFQDFWKIQALFKEIFLKVQKTTIFGIREKKFLAFFWVFDQIFIQMSIDFSIFSIAFSENFFKIFPKSQFLFWKFFQKS